VVEDPSGSIEYYLKMEVFNKATPDLESLTLGLDYSEAELAPQWNLTDWKRYAIDVGIAGLISLFFGCTGRPLPVVSVLGSLGGRFVDVCGGRVAGRGRWIAGSVIDDTEFILIVFLRLGSFTATSGASTFGRDQLNSWKGLLVDMSVES
jgi:hypothetical protein